MTGEANPAFVDTNILSYALERRRSAKQSAARTLVDTLMADGRIRVSTQVLQELYVTLTRKVREPWPSENALAALDILTAWPLFVTDYPAIRAAAQLARDAVTSFWDALIVVAAARSGAAILYTEDLNPGQELLGVLVVNPFQTSPV